MTMMHPPENVTSHPVHQGQQHALRRKNIRGFHPANARLWRVSRVFEAMFVQQLLSVMHKTVPSSGLIDKGFAENVQSSMFNQALAKAVSQRGGLGIARSIYRQFSHAGTQAPTSAADKTLNRFDTGVKHDTHWRP